MLVERTAEFLELWEKFEGQPHDNGSGNWTIGYGFTEDQHGNPVTADSHPISQDVARTILRDKISALADEWMNDFPHWRMLNVFRRSALLSLSYNTGYRYKDGNHDTLDAALESDLLEVPDIFLLYAKANGGPLLGLQRRRMSEGALWNGCSPEAAYEAYQDWVPAETPEPTACETGNCPVPPIRDQKKVKLSKKHPIGLSN